MPPAVLFELALLGPQLVAFGRQLLLLLEQLLLFGDEFAGLGDHVLDFGRGAGFAHAASPSAAAARRLQSLAVPGQRRCASQGEKQPSLYSVFDLKSTSRRRFKGWKRKFANIRLAWIVLKNPAPGG